LFDRIIVYNKKNVMHLFYILEILIVMVI